MPRAVTVRAGPAQESKVLAQEEYRLLCGCCAKIPLQLTDEQQRVLAEQTGYTWAQAQRAAQLIRDNKVPRWYAWVGAPEAHVHRGWLGPAQSSVTDCDCENGDREWSLGTGPPAIITIPLTSDQQAVVRETTACTSFALELAMDVLHACVFAPGEKCI